MALISLYFQSGGTAHRPWVKGMQRLRTKDALCGRRCIAMIQKPVSPSHRPKLLLIAIMSSSMVQSVRLLLTMTDKCTDLMKWAYVTKSAKKSSKCDMGNGKDIYGLQGILEAKGISANKRDWECVRITHSDPEDKSANINDQTYTNPRTEETVRVR